MPINLSDIAGGTGGFVINGQSAYDQSGFSVASAGDVNGDGFEDLIVGSPYADPVTNANGRSYVVFGKGDTGSVDLAVVDSGFGGTRAQIFGPITERAGLIQIGTGYLCHPVLSTAEPMQLHQL